MSVAPLLRVQRLAKAFAAPVLREIDFALASGEVVALTGENGAGKSTLSKIIAGLVTADSGEMEMSGVPYRPASRAAAERAGVRMVLQELGLISTLSIAENLELSHIPARFGFIQQRELATRARQHLARVGLGDLDPSRPVGDLGIGQQQLVEIARGFTGATRVLILDEPTAMLTAPEIERLFEQIARLRNAGVGIIYISHRLDELARIADRVVVLRDGQLVMDGPMRELTHDDIVRAMVGHAPALDEDRPRRQAGRQMLRVTGLTRGTAVRDVSFALHANEVFGLAGLVGSGRTELLRAIFGADPPQSGEIAIDGQRVTIGSPVEAVRHGIGLLTEDRKSQGLLLAQPIGLNLTVADLRSVSRRGWVDGKAEKDVFRRWAELLRIRARDDRQYVDELSGGNQQKVLLARWLHRDCRVLLLDEPTRGVDVGARGDIYAELDALAAAGKTLLMVSSDLRELMAVCDRIGVMSAGRLVQIFERGEWTEQALLAAAFSAYGAGKTVTAA
jgi:ribose transport system ATP-binding protein